MRVINVPDFNEIKKKYITKISINNIFDFEKIIFLRPINIKLKITILMGKPYVIINSKIMLCGYNPKLK